MKQQTSCFAPKIYKYQFLKPQIVNFTVPIGSIEVTSNDCESDLLKYNIKLGDDYKQLVDQLKELVYEKVISSPEVETIVNGGGMVVMQLFDAIYSSPETLLPRDWWKQKYEKAEKEIDQMRIIADYIASMTDNYACKMRNRLYGNDFGSVFERL